MNISIEQFSELFNHEKIVGVKYTAQLLLTRTYRKAFHNQVILSGFEDEMLVQTTISGVDGAIGSTYNVNGSRAQKSST